MISSKLFFLFYNFIKKVKSKEENVIWTIDWLVSVLEFIVVDTVHVRY